MSKTREEKNAYAREWAKNNPEKRRATDRAWREKHGVKHAAQRRAHRAANRVKLDAAKRKWERENPEKVRDQKIRKALRSMQTRLSAHLRFHYEITIDDYKALLIRQGGKCAICFREKGNSRGHRLYIDHDHKTGLIRGLLCGRCNSAIGYFDEHPTHLRRAASYLEKWRGAIATDTRSGVQPLLASLSESQGEA